MKKIVLVALVLTLISLQTAPVLADEPFPTRPITTVVPFAAGGGTDAAARVFADYLTKYIGQPVVVVNKPGASATLGGAFIAQSKPDGYTVGYLGTSSTLTELFSQYVKADYTSEDVFPIAQWSGYIPAFICRIDKPFKTFKELVEHAKKESQVIFASQGRSTSNELALRIIDRMEGLKSLKYVPFKGDSEIISAILGGHADFGCVTFTVAAPLVAAGKIRVLAIATEDRAPGLPDVKNFFELGYDVVFRQLFLGMFGPKGVPDPVVKKLEKATEQVTKDPSFASKMNNINMPVIYKSSEQLRSLIQNIKKSYFDLQKKGMF